MQLTERVSRAALPLPENVLLWTMRTWVIGITERLPVEERIQTAFATLKAPCAVDHLYEFMWMLSHGASRKIALQCVCAPNLTSDEQRLLEVLTFCQHERTFEALIILRSMMHGRAAIAAAHSAGRIVDVLTAAGHELALPDLNTTQYTFDTEGISEDTQPMERWLH